MIAALRAWWRRWRRRGSEPASHRFGRQAERLARRYLRRRGLKLLDQRVRVGRDEIDLVMRERQLLVFVEVRGRTRSVGAAARSFDRQKKRRFERAVRAYLARRGWTRRPWRADLVLVSPRPGSRDEVVHERGVFGSSL